MSLITCFLRFRSQSSLILVSILFLSLISSLEAHALTYTWVGTGGNNNWSTASNWEPVRIPASDDILLFDGNRTGSANVLVDFVSPQTIGQLRFINNIVVVLTVLPNADATAAPPARQLTLAAALTGASFEVTTGSSVQVKSPEGVRSTAGLAFHLGTEGTALIAGSLIFGNSTTASLTNDPHQLLSLKKGVATIQFVAGSVFRAERLFTGFPFNDRAESSGTVVFRNGSTYDHRGGSAPFGTSLPTAPVTIFEKGSRYTYSVTSTTAGPQLSGRTYGFLEYNRSTTGTAIVGGSIAASSLPLTILDDLLILTGNVRLNVANANIKGNLVLNGGALVNTLSASNIAFNGNNSQLITSAASPLIPVSFGDNITVTIDNATGVTTQTPTQIAKSLTLTKGNVVTTAAGSLTLTAGATINGHENSFIVGSLTRMVAASGSTSLDFPIGSATAYRPLTLTINHADATEVRYTVEQVKGKPIARTFTGDIKKVSSVRYFTVTRSSLATNFINGSIKLSYGSDDQVDSAEKLRIAKSSADNQSWEDLGGTGSGIPAGTVTSVTPFASFGTFALASTYAESVAGNNPLPVNLISFSATSRTQGVVVQWATSMEKNNDGFEVERSSEGRQFERVAKVKGKGQSTQKQTYCIIDGTPLSSLTTYYRLRQIDFDGMVAYSNIVAVKSGAGDELFPNPAQRQLTFQLSYNGLATYRIVSATGQALRQGQTTTAATTLDISTLPAGLYYLEIERAQGRQVHKFMKQVE
ncbi:T9SS type A sorting domain-containing protein [Hymenobacter sp. HD11105]